MAIQKRSLFISLLMASSVLLPAGAMSSVQATADEIIEKNLAAVGGREALGKLTSRRGTGTMTIGTPGGDLTGPVELLSKAPNKVRVLITLDLTPMGVSDKMVIEQKFNGTDAWMLNSMQGDQEIKGNQLDNMRSNAFPTPLLTYKTAGAKAELMPREDVNGKSALVILFTPKTGSPTRMYFDPESYLLLRTKATINSPETGDLEQTSDVSDYRTVDGIKWPFRVVNSSSMQTITIKLDKIEHNVPIDDAVFSAKTPAGVR
jgi:outer membrane lipoprotein-sorting protein